MALNALPDVRFSSLFVAIRAPRRERPVTDGTDIALVNTSAMKAGCMSRPFGPDKRSDTAWACRRGANALL